MAKKFSRVYAEEIMEKEFKIIKKMGYKGGGYEKDQEENKKIYLAVKKAMRKIPKLDREYYNYFEDQNYHSLNKVLEDLNKF